ncbi:hypothetical protein AAW14_18745, partial [Streptomyces hygroscopicus]|uniref:condensation domain-containing protein n=1 Tax=Streptomyces hygroscopicus TaxID=1912 RepID=UPI00223EE81F
MTGVHDARLPLSAAQRGVWFGHQLDHSGRKYQIAEYFDIRGPVDPALFDAAWRRAFQETDAMRVRFVEDDEQPWQIVEATPHVDVPVLDVSSEPHPEEAAVAWMSDELARPADLLDGPLHAVALFKVSQDRYFWYQRFHHSIMDGYSGAVFVRRVADVYTALAAGRGVEDGRLGALRELIDDDAAYRSSEQFALDRAHWIERLADRPEAATLARRAGNTGGGTIRHSARLTPDEHTRLTAATGRALPTVVVAAVAAYLHRLTGRRDLLIGLPVTARAESAAKAVPGMLSNLLPLRLDVTAGMSLEQLTRQVLREARAALRHQRYRYEDIRRDLGLAHTDEPLVGPTVNVLPYSHDRGFAGNRMVSHNLAGGLAEDLSVSVYDRGDGQGLRIGFDANGELYSADELAAHQRGFLRVLRAMADNPGIRVGEVELTEPAEEKLVLGEWSGGAV